MIKKIINGEEVYFTEPDDNNVVMGRQLEDELLGQGALYYKLKSEEMVAGADTKKPESNTKYQPQRKPYNNLINLKRNSMVNIAKSIDTSSIKTNK